MTSRRKLGSVVIPAYNEAGVIGRCLDALFTGLDPDQIEVVVACNGCTDETARAAGSSGRPGQVLDLDVASKPAAIRAAERVVETFPRIYLDADVILPGSSARILLERLATGPSLAARPPIHYQTAASSALVRSYFRARARIPAVMNSLWGAGVYGLSEAGRSRFGAYPDVIAEDLFVDQQFERDEIEIVESAPVLVVAPRRTADLTRVLRRAYRGKAEARVAPALSRSASTPTGAFKD